MNILFTCAGRRNYLIEYFNKELKGIGKTVAADMQLSAPAMKAANVAYQVPEIYDSYYIEKLLDICIKENISALFSLNDLELPVLADQKKKFDAIGVNLIVSSPSVIEICFDKSKTCEFAESIGLNVPLTYKAFNDAKSSLLRGDMKFPIVVKPRWGSASIGLEFPLNFEELDLSYKLLYLKLNRTILGRVSSTDIDHSILIQEKITGKEYGLDILNDLNGNFSAVYVKEKLAMRAGETDKAKLISNPEIESIGRKIGEKLGHIGNLDCDILERNGIYYLLEMNPRFGGGYPFTYMSGGNFPLAIISWLNGTLPDKSCFSKVYGKIFSKCDILIQVD